jgi:elongation factor G
MKEYLTDKIRNVVLIGHGGSGKTTLAEAMLYNGKAVERAGTINEGTTVSDFDPEEIKRQISISASVLPVEWKNNKINILDTPGYFDFMGEVVSSLRVAEGAVLLVDAASGIEVGTEKGWEYTSDRDMPRILFVNKMNRENADFFKVVEELREQFGVSIAPFQIPIGAGETFKGIINVVDMKAREYTGKEYKDTDIPDEYNDKIQPIREMVMEAVAETDDELMMKFFDGEAFTEEEIREGLRKGVLSGKIVPVLCGSGDLNIGVETLMDTMANYLPSPKDGAKVLAEDKNGEPAERKLTAEGQFTAQVFKTIADPYVGKISIFKVISGSVTSNTPLYNVNKEEKEKFGNIFFVRGKKQINAEKAVAGDIVAVAKLQHTTTGDTLAEGKMDFVYSPIQFAEPSISMAIVPKAKGDEEKISGGLHRLLEEDPTFLVEKNSETGDLLVAGQGEVHIEVITRKLASKFGVDVELKDPRLPYRETIKGTAKAEGKHKKQSGGRGQYGHVWIEFEPLNDLDTDMEFVDKVVGGAVPRQFIPAVEKGLKEAVKEGVLAGYPVVGIRATLYDGSFHSVDSDEMSFKIAANLSYKKGMNDAKPVLLEPIMKLEIVVPEDYMGDVIGDINKKRGRILGMEPRAGKQLIIAEAPLGEMFKYATDLRSMTQARGSFTMRFERYEEAPPVITEKVIAESKKEE